MVWDTSIDIAYLQQTQKAVAELACDVINTVTHMGWQFPGSRGPEKQCSTNRLINETTTMRPECRLEAIALVPRALV